MLTQKTVGRSGKDDVKRLMRPWPLPSFSSGCLFGIEFHPHDGFVGNNYDHKGDPYRMFFLTERGFGKAVAQDNPRSWLLFAELYALIKPA